MSDTTAAATIYYTTDGSTPTTNSTKYTSAITVSSTETIQAIAVASGYTNSAVASALFTITSLVASAPTFSPGTGSYTSTQTVTIGDITPGATIYYTTDGSVPTTSSTKYTAPITVSASETIQAIAVASGYANSPVSNATLTINGSTSTVATPTFSPLGGTYTSAPTVTISDTTSGATIYYTTNGTLPTTSSTLYTGPFVVSATETIEAVAFVPDSKCLCIFTVYFQSAPASATYTISAPTAATPTFSPAPGTYTSAQTVTLADATAGATIYYTTNGSTPTTSSTKYSSAIAVSSTQTIQAIAVASGYTNSAVASATYTINIAQTAAATPTFSPAPGTYTAAQTVTISDTTSGATIYYTTDGTIPSASSNKYSAPVTISTTETLSAIAIASGYTNSAVATGLYTINTVAPSFALNLSYTSLTVSPGSTATDTITIVPQNGFNQAVTFSCSGLATGVTCSFSPPSVTPSGSSTTDQLTVSVASNFVERHDPTFPWQVPGGISLAGLGFLFCLRSRRFRRGGQWLVVLGSVILAQSMTGCSSGSSNSSGKSATTDAVTVTGTAGSLTSSATVTVTIP